MNEMNRIYNADNPFQGDFKRVLCVCSAGLLRSPTAAVVLSQAPFNYNTRAVGIEESYALIPIDKVLLTWSQEIVCMTEQHEHMLNDMEKNKNIICLDIQDSFRYRDPELMKVIKEKYAKIQSILLNNECSEEDILT